MNLSFEKPLLLLTSSASEPKSGRIGLAGGLRPFRSIV